MENVDVVWDDNYHHKRAKHSLWSALPNGVSSPEIPDDILVQIMTFVCGSNPSMKEFVFMYTRLSRVSKKFRNGCIRFSQSVPIHVTYRQWSSHSFKLTSFMCRNKMKIANIRIKEDANNLLTNIFIYILDRCDLSSLEELEVECFPLDHGQFFDYHHTLAVEAGIPRDVVTSDKIRQGDDLMKELCRVMNSYRESPPPLRHLSILTKYDEKISHFPEHFLSLPSKFSSSLETLDVTIFDSSEDKYSSLLKETIRELKCLNSLSLKFSRKHDFGLGHNAELRIEIESETLETIYVEGIGLQNCICPNLQRMKIRFIPISSALLGLEEYNLGENSAILARIIENLPKLKEFKIAYERDERNFALAIKSQSLEEISTIKSSCDFQISSIVCPRLKKVKACIYAETCHLRLGNLTAVKRKLSAERRRKVTFHKNELLFQSPNVDVSDECEFQLQRDYSLH